MPISGRLALDGRYTRGVNAARPDPDTLLARVQEEEARQQRGKLKVFFGAAAGVGKTYAMLEAAREQRADGVDVVAGYVETHGRAETEALLQGFKEGKVYMPEQAQEALRNFFRKGNLIALRELALRRTAERVDAQMRVYMREHAIGTVWPATERLLVCVSPTPDAARLVRAAKRMAEGLGAPWIAAYVETPAQLRLPQGARDTVIQTLRLAEQLGAETVT